MSQKTTTRLTVVLLVVMFIVHAISLLKIHRASEDLFSNIATDTASIMWSGAHKGALAEKLPENLVLSIWWNLVIWPILMLVSFVYTRFHYWLLMTNHHQGKECPELVCALTFVLAISGATTWGFFSLSGLSHGLWFSLITQIAIVIPAGFAFWTLHEHGVAGFFAPTFVHISLISVLIAVKFGFVAFCLSAKIIIIPIVGVMSFLTMLFSYFGDSPCSLRASERR